MQFFKCVTQIFIISTVGRINAAEYHRINLTISRKCLRCRIGCKGNCIADSCISYCFNRSGNISNLACAKLVCLFKRSCTHIANLNNGKFSTRCHHTHSVARFNLTVHNSNINNNTTIRIINRVENKRFKRFIVITLWRLNFINYIFKHFFNILTCFCADSRCVHTRNTDNILNLMSHPVRVCGRKVDFINHRQNIKVVIKRKISVCKSLCLHTLRCVNY